MKFERKQYIKDLYDSKKVLNSFDWIQFESFNIFKRCIKDELFQTVGRTIELFINTKEEYLEFTEVLKKTDISKKTGVIVRLFSKELTEFILSNDDLRFEILLDFEDYIEIGETEKNIVKIIKINYDNYIYKLNDIQREAIKTNIKLFKLEFDYNSFKNITLEELEKLQFSIFQLRTAMIFDKNFENFHVVQIRKFFKQIFVSNDLMLYINEKKNGWCLDLIKYLGNTGESIYFTELNNIRKYIDLNNDAMLSFLPIRNWFLIDYSQHIFLNDIPLITTLIDRWLYVKY